MPLPAPHAPHAPPALTALTAASTRVHVQVKVAQTGDAFACATDESLLAGMLRLGRKGIPAGCVNGGCGVCKVRIVTGAVRALGAVSRAHVSAQESANGYTLACRVAPTEAVRLEVAGRLHKPFSLNGGARPGAAPNTWMPKDLNQPKET